MMPFDAVGSRLVVVVDDDDDGLCGYWVCVNIGGF